MAINKNHEFEELNGLKCAIVERNVPQERIDFLKSLLAFNNFDVVVAIAPPPKAAVPAAPKPPTPEGEQKAEVTIPVEPVPPPAPTPELFTIGVTDVMFNPINAIFGRLLKTPGGRVVTLAYWQQKEAVSHDEVPYFEKKN